jgi:hypothetical protein
MSLEIPQTFQNILILDFMIEFGTEKMLDLVKKVLADGSVSHIRWEV